MKKLFLNMVLISILCLSGCTAVTVRPIDASLQLKHVCIEDCQSTCFEGEMMGVVRDGFDRHGITTQVYSGTPPSECEYNLSIMCERSWDLAMYMKHAELRLYHNNLQVGYAEYHLNGGGGLSPTKWGNTRTKMEPVVDEMLIGYPRRY
ncbi:MAG: Sbal_3080 family lipoprotein [Desulfocapsaceae bacterium]|nr:Sbal_3080 family lipoprotein [Desulfocapsaceae bacterium]